MQRITLQTKFNITSDLSLKVFKFYFTFWILIAVCSMVIRLANICCKDSKAPLTLLILLLFSHCPEIPHTCESISSSLSKIEYLMELIQIYQLQGLPKFNEITLANFESISLKVLLHKFPILVKSSLLFLAAKSCHVKTESLFSGLMLSKQYLQISDGIPVDQALSPKTPIPLLFENFPSSQLRYSVVEICSSMVQGC